MSSEKIFTASPLTTITVPASGTAEYIIDTDSYNFVGYFSAQTSFTGAGSINIGWSVSNLPDRTGFTANADIITGSTTGVVDYTTFEPTLARFIKITLTETAGTETDVKLFIRAQ